MGIFTELKEKVSSAVHTIKNALVDVCHTISSKVEEWSGKAKDYFANIKEEINTPKTYTPTDSDKKVKEKHEDSIKSIFPLGIESIEDATPEQRKQQFKDLVREAATNVGLGENIPELEYFIPESEEDYNKFGWYCFDDHTIALNEAMVVTDDITVVKEQIFTVIHEMEHARQFAAMDAYRTNGDYKKYGYTENQVLQYIKNWTNYIRPRENYEAYVSQALERDAFGMENMIKSNESIL